MAARGRRWLIFGVVLVGLAAAFIGARMSGRIAGPDEVIADVLSLPPGLIFVVFGVMKMRAAANHELPGRTPLHLPQRLTVEGGVDGSLATMFVWWSLLAWGLAFAFVVSLFPKSWDESWYCTPCSDGDGTCCDIVDGGVLGNVLFVLLVLGGSLYLLFGVISGFMGFRELRHMQRLPHPIVEVDCRSVRPGQSLEGCVQLLGRGRCDRVRLDLECEEATEESVGSGTSRNQEVVLRETLLDHRDVQLRGVEPVIYQGQVRLHPHTMHTFASKNNQVRWRLVLTVSASVDVRGEYPIEVSSIA